MTQKVAIITGAGRGLGLAMAESLIASDYRVVGWDLKPETTFKHANFSMETVNVADQASVKAAAEKCRLDFGVPTVLINNAGITRDVLLHKMSLEDFEATLKVNVVGSFLPTQIVGMMMRDEQSALQKSGKDLLFKRIVMLSSIAGIYGNVGQANYAASKAAVVGFMKSVAKEWGRFNISTVAVAPGFMKTEMTATIPPELVQGFIERTPLKRMGQPSELAAFIKYLCTPESAFLHGELIAFSGGLLL